MKTVRFALVLVASLLLAACENEQQVETPLPFRSPPRPWGDIAG